MPTLFLKITKIQQRESCKYADFNDPTPVEDAPARNAFEYLQHGVYCQKLELLTYIFAADRMGLCLLLFTQLFLEVKRSESRSAGRKRILT